MKSGMKSVIFKVSILFIFLAVVNMVFFSIIIYENQIELITENTKYHANGLAGTLAVSMERFSKELQSDKIFKIKTEKQVITEIANIIREQVTSVDDFIIFTREGRAIHKSRPELEISSLDARNGIKAAVNRDFTGGRYFSTINEDTYEISFYIPFKVPRLEESVLFLKYQMKDIGRRLMDLYRLIALIIGTIVVLHILFAIVFFRMLVKPVKNLHEASIEISKGDLSARSDINGDDEIGEVSNTFNSMADSIQEKSTILQEHNDRMEFELNVAGEVQQTIFPKINKNERYSCSIFHKSLEKISSDYYDIFELADGAIGFLMLDVSSHGVPAALITMTAKEKFRRLAPDHDDPAELIRSVNTEICEFLGDDKLSGLYFSAFYLVLDSKNYIRYCNAAHPESFLVRYERKKIAPLVTDGSLIGISGDMNSKFGSKRVLVQSRDRIIMYSDGISEAVNDDDEKYGMDRLVKSISSSYTLPIDEMLDSLVNELGGFTDIDSLKDEATLIIIEVK